MEKLAKFFKDKAAGFYVMAAGVLLSLITAAVYVFCYIRSQYMSWFAFIFLLVAAAAAVAFTLLKMHRLAPVVLAAFNFLALLFFVYGIYLYVSIVMVGIDIRTFGIEFIICSVLFMASFLTGNAGIYIRQIKNG